MGLRGSPTTQIVFENMRVPAENLLEHERCGFLYALQALDHGRLGISAQALGIARAALEHSVRYAGERRQFGKPIKEFEGIQFKLADMATRVTAARALLYVAATAKDRGDLRRVRLCVGLSHRTPVSRCEGDGDLRRNVRDSAHHHRAGALRTHLIHEERLSGVQCI
jgi:alkylation response protein AidB-like acyl-CoA dehydrogenase